MVKIDTNQQNTILVHSYLSETGRQTEKDYAAGLYSSVEEGLMTAEALDLQDEERVENESTESEDSAAPMTEEI